MIESESKIRVRYVETDAGGVVHHSSFIPWLEVARVEMMDNVGLPYTKLESQGIHLVVLEMHMKILKPAYFDDRLLVKTWIKESPKVRLKIGYEIYRGETLLATAETLHAFMSNEKKGIKPPKSFMAVIKEYFDVEEN